MKSVATVKGVKDWRLKTRDQGEKVGFVPTMGYLHEGHLSLVKALRPVCDRIAVSVFVNKLQFNDPADFEKYPVDLERDTSELLRLGVDLLFVPALEEIYPKGFQSTVSINEITKRLEGAFRPGHFEGVTTVVSILFNILEPDFAIFGEKDFQQLRVIEQMVSDLRVPVQIVRGQTVREHDGLAMSSRNVRLSPQARAESVSLSRALRLIEKGVSDGITDPGMLVARAREELAGPLTKVQYLEIADEETLESVSHLEKGKHYRAFVAAFVDEVRLIDNVPLRP